MYIYYIYKYVIAKIVEMKSDTEQKMKLEQLYKVGSVCELNYNRFIYSR